MQLGFVSAILPDLNLKQVAEFARQTGYDCVELMCWPPSKADRRYAGVTHIDVTNFSDEHAREVTNIMADAGVAISGLGYYPNPLSPNAHESKAAIGHIRKVLEATARLGLTRMNTFVGRDWTRSVEDNLVRFQEVWRPIVACAEGLGVRIGIENCPMLFSSDEWPGGKNLAVSPSIWRKMFELIPSGSLGLNYDPSHMIWQHMDYIKPIREFASRFVHVHAKDVRIDRHRLDEVGILAAPLQYHVPKLPGMGDVDWGKFFSALTDSGYRGPVCVEVEDRAYEESLERRQASLRQSHTFLRNYVPR
jgi:sugar phosphate isomerase/epimerase